MAWKQLMIVVIAITAAILPNASSAMQFVVGDDEGWSINGNYTAWAEGKEFFVGDSLVFNYEPGSHNVYKVSGPEFRACQVSNNGGDSAPLTSGNDVVPLKSPGKKWYLCGVAGHCNAGMKLLITVRPSSAASPWPSPPQTSAVTRTVFPSPLIIIFSATFAALVMKLQVFV